LRARRSRGSLPVCAVIAADAPPATVQRAAIAEMLARQAAIPDTPGTGHFPATKEATPSFPDHVVYRPTDFSKLGSTKLGLYIFGNGACSNDGASSRLHLLEVASHGYLAIASGRLRSGPGATVPRAATPPPAPPDPTQGGAPAVLPAPATSAADLFSALDWALKQNSDPKSPYYKEIDPKAVAVSGYSCGGLQALEVAKDPRIKTVIIMNSGIFNPGTDAAIPGMNQQKSLLETLHTPTLYVLGGETDIAYANGTDDFKRIGQSADILRRCSEGRPRRNLLGAERRQGSKCSRRVARLAVAQQPESGEDLRRQGLRPVYRSRMVRAEKGDRLTSRHSACYDTRCNHVEKSEIHCADGVFGRPTPKAWPPS
jgi:hypothetical protein